MRLGIDVEAQNGLNWDNWMRLARAVEDLGFDSLYRSDHLLSLSPPEKDSLELWTSLTWLADNTRRILFGPMVSPVSFRHPVITAHSASAVHNLSGGRLVLGLGAGWSEREHNAFGFDLLPLNQRFNRFEEGLEVITRLLHSDGPVNFDGNYYRLNHARLMPRPDPPRGPGIMVGGRGSNRTLHLAAKYADVWNTFRIPLNTLAQLSQKFDEVLVFYGREPESIERTFMANIILGKDDADVRRQLEGKSFESWRDKGLVGTASYVIDQIGEVGELGFTSVLLQWHDPENIDLLERVAVQVLPHL